MKFILLLLTSLTLLIYNICNGQTLQQNLLTIQNQILTNNTNANTYVLLQNTTSLINNNTSAGLKAWLVKIKILQKDALLEDSFYFKNSNIIDSSLNTTNDTAYKAYLHVLQFERPLNFYVKVNAKYYNQQILFRHKATPVDYATLSNNSLYNLAFLHLDTALRYFNNNNNTQVENFLWLYPKAYKLAFKPNLYDVVMFLGLQYDAKFKTKVLDNYYNSEPLLTANLNTFKSLILDTSAKANNSIYLIAWYNAIKNNTEKEIGIMHYIKSTLLLHNTIPLKTLNTFLPNLTNFNSSTIESANATTIYLKCLILYTKANFYYNAATAPDSASAAERWNHVAWLNIFNANKTLLAKYPFIYNHLSNLQNSVRLPSISISTETPMVTTDNFYVEFKNIDTLYYVIAKTPNIFIHYNNVILNKNNILLNVSIINKDSVSINIKDYQTHKAKLVLPNLPIGCYKIIYYNKPINLNIIDSNNYGILNFEISNILLTQVGNQIHCLNRTTGLQMGKTEILKTNNRDSIIAKTFTNNIGQLVISKKEAWKYIAVNNKDTTCLYPDAAKEQNYNYNQHTKSKEDTYSEFYEDNLNLHLFTDRAIYKPGHTIFFKGIATTLNPETGLIIPLTWKNLKHNAYLKLKAKLTNLFNKHYIYLSINNAYGKTIDTIKVSPNKYGSFSGSYILPKGCALGSYNFNCISNDFDHSIDMEIDNQNDGEFTVEQYKRPTYEITIKKPSDTLKIADDYDYEVQIKSFSGASLNNVKIYYTLEENFDTMAYVSDLVLLIKPTLQPINLINNLHKQIDSFGYTNEKGIFLIPINVAYKNDINNYTKILEYRSYLNCTAIAETGESYEARERYSVNNRAIKLMYNLANTYTTTDTLITQISINTKLNTILPFKIKCTINKIKTYDTKTVDYDLYTQAFFTNINNAEKDTIVLDTIIAINKRANLQVLLNKFKAGTYYINVQGYLNNNIVTPIMSKTFNIATTILNYEAFKNTIEVKETDNKQITVQIKKMPNPIYILVALDYFKTKHKAAEDASIYTTVLIAPNQTNFIIPVPINITANASLKLIFVKDNKLYTIEKKLIFDSKIIYAHILKIERIKYLLQPGIDEVFTLSLKTNKKYKAFELLSSMYDASLDKIEKKDWTSPNKNVYRYNTISTTGYKLNNYFSTQAIINNVNILAYKTKAVWWDTLAWTYSDINIVYKTTVATDNFNVKNTKYEEVIVIGYGAVNKDYGLMGRVAGMSISNLNGIAGAFTKVTIRGINSIVGNNNALIIIDGEAVNQKDFEKLNPNIFTDIMVLKPAEATALYGSRGANGVIIASTKGLVTLPKPPEPEVKVRSNFKETAFFYPHLHADKNGLFTINFTMPQTATKWKWRNLAHSKHGNFIYKETFINTQLPLMVQPYLPRVLYQGDSVVIKTSIANLQNEAIKGVAKIIIEDDETGNDVTVLFVKNANNTFSCNANTNTTNAFILQVPTNWLSPIKITIKANTTNFGDGEAYTLPIISKQIFASSSIIVPLKPNADTAIIIPKLKGNIYAVGAKLAPVKAQNLLQAVAYLTQYQHNCAEQITSKMVGNIVALQLLKSNIKLLPALVQIINSNSEATNNNIIQTTMPWLSLKKQAEINNNTLLKLLDSNILKYNIKTEFEKLKQLQHSNGGIMWFNNYEPNINISVMVLKWLSKINAANYFTDKYEYNNFVNKLYNYCNNSNAIKYNLAFIIAKGYYLKNNNLPFINDSATCLIINNNWANFTNMQLHSKGELCIASAFYNPINYNSKILNALNNIITLAANDSINGMRWKSIADNYDIFNTEYETVALLGEALDYPTINHSVHSNIETWLLNTKATNYWVSTKTTAAVLQYLIKGSAVEVNKFSTAIVNLNNITTNITNNIYAPSSYYNQIVNSTYNNKVNLKNTSSVNLKATVVYYYFTTPNFNVNNNDNFNITKTLQVIRNNTMETINENSWLNIGDNLKTTLTITTAKAIPYVFINDNRSACLEPTNEKSGYVYNGLMSYYQNIKDAAMEFFIQNIPAGTNTISYHSKITHAGLFTNGAAQLQAMYNPELNIWSNCNSIKVK